MHRRKNKRAQGIVEYGLILGLVALVAIASLNASGSLISSLVQKIADGLKHVLTIMDGASSAPASSGGSGGGGGGTGGDGGGGGDAPPPLE